MAGAIEQPWHERLPGRWDEQCGIATRFMDPVKCGVDADGLAFILGTYRLLSNSGHELDRFRLRIVFPAEFPQRRCHPRVYLESHRDWWVPDPDSHIEDSWRLCLFVAQESGLDFEREGELEQLFLEIHTFLLKERLYQQKLQKALMPGSAKPSWPGPARAHGVEGLNDVIRESGRKLGRNDPCVCGSGKKFKRCCLGKIEAHRRSLGTGNEGTVHG